MTIRYTKKTEQNALFSRDFTRLYVVESPGYSDRGLAELIEKEIGIPAIRTMSLLDALAVTMRKILAEGKSVKLNGFGAFKATLEASENGTPRVKRVLFTASPELRKAMKEVTFEEVVD